MKSDFTLIPFNRDPAPAISVSGNIQRQDNQLTIAYKITGISKIIVPDKADLTLRQFDLWEHTCCEFFIGIKDSPQYWEFNLSPTGHWNVFRFPDYRQNIAEEMAFDKLPFQVLQDDCLHVVAKIDLNKIVAPEQSLQVGVTAVIEDKKNQLSYWALSHPGKEADFHLRASMAIAL